MIRISRLPPNGVVSFKVEGRAQGTFGEEFRKFVADVLAREQRIALDLKGLQSIDQPTLDFLAERRGSILIEEAPQYVDRWLKGVEDGTLLPPGALAPEG